MFNKIYVDQATKILSEWSILYTDVIRNVKTVVSKHIFILMNILWSFVNVQCKNLLTLLQYELTLGSYQNIFRSKSLNKFVLIKQLKYYQNDVYWTLKLLQI